jgi:hypothetical protein
MKWRRRSTQIDLRRSSFYILKVMIQRQAGRKKCNAMLRRQYHGCIGTIKGWPQSHPATADQIALLSNLCTEQIELCVGCASLKLESVLSTLEAQYSNAL